MKALIHRRIHTSGHIHTYVPMYVGNHEHVFNIHNIYIYSTYMHIHDLTPWRMNMCSSSCFWQLVTFLYKMITCIRMYVNCLLRIYCMYVHTYVHLYALDTNYILYMHIFYMNTKVLYVHTHTDTHEFTS